MTDQQQDFFGKLDQKPTDFEREKTIYELAREVVRHVTNKAHIEDSVRSAVKERGADPADIPAICKLVENTLIDDGATDADEWRR